MKNYLVKADKVTSTTDKKYAMFCGRWQPLHDGHKFIIQRVLDEGQNVLICIRDVKPDDKNHQVPEEVSNISATKVREQLRKEGKI